LSSFNLFKYCQLKLETTIVIQHPIMTLLLPLSVFVMVLGLTSGCNLPPSLWCSDAETAKACGVQQQCRDWMLQGFVNRFEASLGVSSVKKSVNVTLAFESLCPGCRNFITSQLWPVYNELKDYMTVKLLPYGNAEEVYNAKTHRWVFYCQHGPKECYGNIVETCAIFLNKREEAAYFPFIHCMEQLGVDQAEKCANKTGQIWVDIKACAEGPNGNFFQHIIASETPKHDYVPWIIFNGVHNEDIQNKAQSNLKKLVCDSIPGTKPAPCLAKENDRCYPN